MIKLEEVPGSTIRFWSDGFVEIDVEDGRFFQSIKVEWEDDVCNRKVVKMSCAYRTVISKTTKDIDDVFFLSTDSGEFLLYTHYIYGKTVPARMQVTCVKI